MTAMVKTVIIIILVHCHGKDCYNFHDKGRLESKAQKPTAELPRRRVQAKGRKSWLLVIAG